MRPRPVFVSAALLLLGGCTVENLDGGRAAPPPPASPDAIRPGSGRPNESNGRCRLFAPELPSPRCCDHDLGFDPSLVRRACGLDLYLGESWQHSCGHYFHRRGHTVWFRIGEVSGTTPARAAAEQALELQRALKSATEPRPFAALPQAYAVRAGETTWAFLPGDGTTKRLVWTEESCSEEGMQAVLAALAESDTPVMR